MNEPLRRALLRARLREDDVAAQPRRRSKNRPPLAHRTHPLRQQPRCLADLVGADEADLWPDAEGPLAARPRPEELGAIYPHRWAVPRDVWTRLFASAEHEIGILAYSALFLAEDAGILDILADKGRPRRHGQDRARRPGQPSTSAERGKEEGIGDAMPAKIRNALALYSPLDEVENVEIRLHRTVLYNSIYRGRRRTPRQPARLRHTSGPQPGFRASEGRRRPDGEYVHRSLRASLGRRCRAVLTLLGW